MTPQVSTSYQHLQEDAAMVWNVNHNLNTYPIIDVFILYNGEIRRVMPKSIEYIDELNCAVTFTEPRSGFARVS
jgi:hypothetical protein